MDLRLRWGLQGADLELEGEDLAIDEGLVTPTLVSLFSDGRVPRGTSTPPETQDLRGWWGEKARDPFGSLIWTLRRQKMIPDTIEAARSHVQAALKWLVQEGIAASVTVVATRIDREVLELDIELRRAPSQRWSTLWEATADTTITTGGVLLNLAAR